MSSSLTTEVKKEGVEEQFQQEIGKGCLECAGACCLVSGKCAGGSLILAGVVAVVVAPFFGGYLFFASGWQTNWLPSFISPNAAFIAGISILSPYILAFFIAATVGGGGSMLMCR
jgi:hypothetical protein